MDNLVVHPKHYNVEGRKECWEEMLDKFGPAAVAIFDVLSAYKYSYRAGEKDGNPVAQDLAKIENYMHHSADVIATNDRDIEGFTIARRVYKQMKKELEHGKY